MPIRRSRFSSRRRSTLRKRPFSSRRRTFRKTRPITRQSTAMIRGPNYSADSTMLKMKLVLIENIAFTSGVAIQRTYAGNSIARPCVVPTAGTVQPSGFDQWKLFYGFYRVMASKIRVSLTNESIVLGSALFSAFYPSTNSTTTTTQQTTIYQPRVKRMIANQGSTRVKTTYMPTATLLGMKSIQPKIDDDLAGVMTDDTTPQNTWYWNLFAQPQDMLSNVDAVLQVELTYYVRLYGRKLAISSA